MVSRFILCLLFLGLLLQPVPAAAQGPAMPPAMVTVAAVRQGEIAPRAQWIGTLRYPKTARVAAETGGKVEKVNFAEGQRVGSGQVLVELDTELLAKALASRRSAAEKIRLQLERKNIDFDRMEALFRKETIAERAWDDIRYEVQILEAELAAARAELERLEAEIAKAKIRAPFDGIVAAKQTEKGEWLSAGSPVATVVSERSMEAVVNVPQHLLPALQPGLEVEVDAGGRTLQGRLVAVIPQGDVATRTFPVKFKIEKTDGLLEGMEAKVGLPEGAPQAALLVNRDALVTQRGQQVVFAVADGKARQVPVEVLGFADRSAGIRGPGLAAGMQVVVKGNERLRDGQPLQIGGSEWSKAQTSKLPAKPQADSL